MTTMDPAKEKEVFCGMADTDTKEYFRYVGNDHYMVKENGYGIQSSVLKELMELGIKKVHITTKTSTKMDSNISDWIKHGKEKDYGNGKQIFLAVKFMETK